MPKIYIPTPLRPYTGKLDTVDVKAGTVGEALQALTSAHPDLKKLLYAEDGKLRSFVKVYLNDDDVRHLNDKEKTQVKESDSLSIIQSVAGGSPQNRN